MGLDLQHFARENFVVLDSLVLLGKYYFRCELWALRSKRISKPIRAGQVNFYIIIIKLRLKLFFADDSLFQPANATTSRRPSSQT